MALLTHWTEREQDILASRLHKIACLRTQPKEMATIARKSLQEYYDLRKSFDPEVFDSMIYRLNEWRKSMGYGDIGKVFQDAGRVLGILESPILAYTHEAENSMESFDLPPDEEEEDLPPPEDEPEDLPPEEE